MAKVVDVKIDEREPAKVESKSEVKKNFEILINNYKKQNPVKYEAKRDELKAKLELMK